MSAEGALAPLVEAARFQDRLVGVGLTDARSMREVIWPAFQRQVAPWAELDYRQEVRPAAVLEALQAPGGGARPDVLVVANPAGLVAGGLVEPYQQPHAGGYPRGWADQAGRWAPLYVQPVVVVHNALHRPLPPARWADLAEPGWAGRAVFEEPWAMLATGPALAELSAALGAAAFRSLLEGLAAGPPLIVADNERSVVEVAIGARHVGLANWNVARRVRATSPLRHTFLDPTPCVPGFAVLAAGARSGGLARLFLAWLTSPEGQRAYASTGRIPALPDLDVPTGLARVLPPGVRPLFGAVDWLAHPEPWVELFRSAFPVPDGPLPSAKGW